MAGMDVAGPLFAGGVAAGSPADPFARVLGLHGLPVEAAELSWQARVLWGRLGRGPVSLADVIDLTTDPAELHGWADELRATGRALVVEHGRDGAVYRRG